MSCGQFEQTFTYVSDPILPTRMERIKKARSGRRQAAKVSIKIGGNCLERIVLHQKIRSIRSMRHQYKWITHKGKQCGAPNQVHQICSHFQAFAAMRADQFGWIEKLWSWDLDEKRALIPLTTKWRFYKIYPTLTLTHERCLFNSLFWYKFWVTPGMGRLVENVKWGPRA
jgi:hypothetical protein